MQTQEEVTHVEFFETILMLCQVATHQVRQRGNHYEVVDTSTVHELLGIHPSIFIGSSVMEDPKNFVEVLHKFLIYCILLMPTG